MEEYQRYKNSKNVDLFNFFSCETLTTAKQKTFSFNLLFKILLVLIFILLFTMIQCNEILKDRFQFCTTNGYSPMLTTIGSCLINDPTTKSRPENFFLIESSPYHVEDYFYQCCRQHIRTSTNQTFFNSLTTNMVTINDILSREDCLFMTLLKKCNKVII